MQLTRPDPSRDRLIEPAEQPWPGRRRSKQGGGIGAWALNIFAGTLLIVLGFVIAVVGVLAGLISQGQLIAMFTGADPASAPPLSAPEVSAPAVEAESPATAATPVLPATQQARVLRDETFGDWRFVCVEAAEGAAANCSAIQQVLVAETGAAVFVWRIVQEARGGLVGIWQVPETVLLAAGLTLDAGTPQPLVIPFESCGGGSCQVVANLAPDFIETLSGAETLSASVVLTNRQSLTIPLSPDGLADALAALSE
jgi:invasion protein IalB